MDRTKFYEIEKVDGIQELDKIKNNLSEFKMVYPHLIYMVRSDDLMRPDLISYKNYGSVQFWWLIMYVNGIQDIFSDLEIGMKLIVPNPLDIYDFYKKFGIR